MRSTMTLLLISFASLIAATFGFPQYTAKQNPIVRYENSLESPAEPVFQVLQHGKRLPQDKLLDSGYCIRKVSKEQGAERINLKSPHDRSVISYVKFTYASMDDQLKKLNLNVINGGVGHNFVDFYFTSESNIIYVSYEIHGIDNTCQAVPTKKVYEVESAKDLDTKLHEARAGKLVILFFTYDEFLPSKELEPVIEKLALENLEVLFFKINANLTEILEKYKVSSQPTFIFIKKDKEVSRFEGVKEAVEKIKEVIKQQNAGEKFIGSIE